MWYIVGCETRFYEKKNAKWIMHILKMYALHMRHLVKI